MTETNNKSGSIPFSDDEQSSAIRAKQLFFSSDYDSALTILKRMLKNHTNDPHLLHNRALNEFYKSNGARISEFKKTLNKVIKQIKNKQDEEDIIASNDKAGCSCAQYNLALIHFYLHQYSFSEEILTQAYKVTDNTDNIHQVKLELLLVDSYLMTHKPAEAEKILDKLEKVLLVPYGNDKSNETEKVKTAAGFELPAAEFEKLRKGVYYMRSRCSLQMKSAKACKREIKTFNSQFESTAGNNHQNHHTVFLKSNFEYMKGNHHKALRVINNAIFTGASEKGTTPLQQHDFMSMYNNNIGVIYFMMEKYGLGCHYMDKALMENKRFLDQVLKQHSQNVVTTNGGSNRSNAPSIKSLESLNKNLRFELLYNYGLFLLHTGYSSSAFDVLLGACQAFHNNPRLWLRIAESCIQKCTGCGKDENGMSRSGGGSKKNQAAMHNTFTEVGSGCHRKIIIRPINNYLSNSKHNLSTTSSPPASMEYAAACLRNAYTILCSAMENRRSSPPNDEKTEKEQKSEKKGQNTLANFDYDSIVVPCLPGSPVTGSSLVHLFAAVLVNSSYVALHLGDALSALHFSEKALRLPELSGCHRYLARTYAAEALVSLDRISKAITYLQIDEITNVSQNQHDETGKKCPPSDDGKTKTVNENGEKNGNKISQTVRLRDSFVPWHFPTNLHCAKAYMLFNLAATHCLRSEYTKADGYIKNGQELLPKNEQTPPHAILLSVYLNLHLDSVGGPKKALQILFQHKLLPDENSSPRAYLCEMEAIGYRQKVILDKNCSSALSGNRSKSGAPQSIATQSITEKAKVNANKTGSNKSRRR